ncbi:MAG: hypothetical protein EON87_05805 [Brevundimonas sp.]|nr:MAG: hypothetical protein EON87_05805 [Brevundimonas sp.]
MKISARFSPAVIAGAALAMASPVCAQANLAGHPVPESTASPDGDLRTGFAQSGVQLEAESGKTDASITFSRTHDASSTTHLFLHSWSVKVTAPLGDDETSADFITDSGLSSGATTAAFNWSRFSMRRVNDASYADIGRVLAAAKLACTRDPTASQASCETATNESLRPWIPATDLHVVFPEIPADHWSTLWSATATLGSKEFKFRDPLSLVEDADRQTPFSMSVQFGGAPQGGARWTDGWYRGVGVEYGESYEASKSRTLCNPPPPSGPQECFTGAFGPPELDRDAVIFGLIRRDGLSQSFGVSWGLQFKAAHDFDSEVSGLEGTVFVLPNAGGRLTGGIRFKLQTDDNDDATEDDNATVGIFVGSPF